MSVPRRTTGWDVEPFADLSAAFVFFEKPVRLVVLDQLTWYILELCDGRSADAVAQKLAEVKKCAQSVASSAVTDRIATLRTRGLLSDAS